MSVKFSLPTVDFDEIPENFVPLFDQVCVEEEDGIKSIELIFSGIQSRILGIESTDSYECFVNKNTGSILFVRMQEK